MTSHNLPLQTMPFIGRDDEIATIVERLTDPACRLLTLVGPGGIGKTRLAIEVAKQIIQAHPPLDGTQFVDLQPVSSDDMLVSALASTLGISLTISDDPYQGLLNHLRTRNSLLVLDNFEHLLEGADLLADIVRIAPDIKILVTSRAALNAQEEWLWHVDGLQVPETQRYEDIDSYSAVKLFVERARRVRPDFTPESQEEHVARICQLVDGMPLALELAAGWMKALSCAEIARDLQQGWELLQSSLRNRPVRHQSMRAVFDQSWERLSDEELEVFPRLSVFRGGFRREAAESVAGASLVTLAGLVDKSFLRLNSAGRYEIHELLRQYGEASLAAIPGAKEDAEHQHCVYYARFLHERQPALRTPEIRTALDEIEADIDNVRASWLWAVKHGKQQPIRQAMHSLLVFCHVRSQIVEGERLFDLAAKRFEQTESGLLAYLILAHAWMAWSHGKIVTFDQHNKGIQLALKFWDNDEFALILMVFFCASQWKTDTPLPLPQQQVYCEFLERFTSRHQHWGVIWMDCCLGHLHLLYEEHDQAEKRLRSSMDSLAQLGDPWGSAWASAGLALTLVEKGRYREADQIWQEHQDICAAVDDRGAAVYVPAERAMLACKQGDYHSARVHSAQGISAYLTTGSHLMALENLVRSLITVFMSEGRYERAVELSTFMWQHANKRRAPGIVDEVSYGLKSLAKKLPEDTYRSAIERGKSLHLRTILEQLQNELAGYSPPKQATHRFDTLTEREFEVLRLVAAGQSNRQIANDLFISVNTVKSHVHHLFGKLGVSSRIQAVTRARELNLL